MRNSNCAEAVLEEVIELTEVFLGCAFVLCQTRIEFVVAQIVRLHEHAKSKGVTLKTTDGKKPSLMKYGSPPVKGSPYTLVETIDAFANYFKHRDSWKGEWSNLKPIAKRTAEIVGVAGAKSGSTGNLRIGSQALGNADYHDTLLFVDILRNWTEAVGEAYRTECDRSGL